LQSYPCAISLQKKMSYSMGHDVLGRVIEVVSGKTLDVFFQDELFKPLKMNNTGFFVPRHKASRLAALYGDRIRAERMAKFYGKDSECLPRGKHAFCRIDGNTPGQSNWIEGSHCKVLSGNGILGNNMGGLVSTLSDQARFHTMILNGGVLGCHRILQLSTVERWCFEDLLPLPGARGKRRRTGIPWSGWSALGERGLKRTKRDPKPLSDEYEEGEVAMGGVASTMWSVNPERDQMTLFFAQTLDGDAWRPDHSTSSGMQASSDNFVVAARATAGRDAAAAAARRKSFRSTVQPSTKKTGRCHTWRTTINAAATTPLRKKTLSTLLTRTPCKIKRCALAATRLHAHVSQSPGRGQLAERLATLQAAMAGVAASGSLPSKELPPEMSPEPTGKAQM